MQPRPQILLQNNVNIAILTEFLNRSEIKIITHLQDQIRKPFSIQ